MLNSSKLHSILQANRIALKSSNTIPVVESSDQPDSNDSVKSAGEKVTVDASGKDVFFRLRSLPLSYHNVQATPLIANLTATLRRLDSSVKTEEVLNLKSFIVNLIGKIKAATSHTDNNQAVAAALTKLLHHVNHTIATYKPDSASDSEMVKVFDPKTKEYIEVPRAKKQDINAIIESILNSAVDSYSTASHKLVENSLVGIIKKIIYTANADKDHFATTVATELGKAIKYAKNRISDASISYTNVVFPSENVEVSDSGIGTSLESVYKQLKALTDSAHFKTAKGDDDVRTTSAVNRLLDYIKTQAESLVSQFERPAAYSARAVVTDPKEINKVLVSYAPDGYDATRARTLQDYVGNNITDEAEALSSSLEDLSGCVYGLTSAAKSIVNKETGNQIWPEVKPFFDGTSGIFDPNFIKFALSLISPEQFKSVMQRDDLARVIHAEENNQKNKFLNSYKHIRQNGQAAIFKDQSLAYLSERLRASKDARVVTTITDISDQINSLLQIPQEFFTDSISTDVVTNITDQLYYRLISAYGSQEDLQRLEKIPGKCSNSSFLTADSKARIEKDIEALVQSKKRGKSLVGKVSTDFIVPDVKVKNIASLLRIPAKSGVSDDVKAAIGDAFSRDRVLSAAMSSKELSGESRVSKFKQEIFDSLRKSLDVVDPSGALGLLFSNNATSTEVANDPTTSVNEDNLRAAKEKLEDYTIEKNSAEDTVDVLAKKLDNFIALHDNLTAPKNPSDGDTTPSEAEIAEYEKAKAEFDKELIPYKKEYEQIESELNLAKEKVSELSKAITKAKTEITILSRKKAAPSGSRAAANADVKRVLNDILSSINALTEDDISKLVSVLTANSELVKYTKIKNSPLALPDDVKHELVTALSDVESIAASSMSDPGNIISHIKGFRYTVSNGTVTKATIQGILDLITSNEELSNNQEIYNHVVTIENMLDLPNEEQVTSLDADQYMDIRDAITELIRHRKHEDVFDDPKRSAGFDLILQEFDLFLKQVNENLWADFADEDSWSNYVTSRKKASDLLIASREEANTKLKDAKDVAYAKAAKNANDARVLLPGSTLSGNIIVTSPEELKKLFYDNLKEFQHNAKLVYDMIQELVESNPDLKHYIKNGSGIVDTDFDDNDYDATDEELDAYERFARIRNSKHMAHLKSGKSPDSFDSAAVLANSDIPEKYHRYILRKINQGTSIKSDDKTSAAFASSLYDIFNDVILTFQKRLSTRPVNEEAQSEISPEDANGLRRTDHLGYAVKFSDSRALDVLRRITSKRELYDLIGEFFPDKSEDEVFKIRELPVSRPVNKPDVTIFEDILPQEQFDKMKDKIREYVRKTSALKLPAFKTFTSIVKGAIDSGEIVNPVRIEPQSSAASLDPRASAFLNLVASLTQFEDIHKFLLSTIGRSASVVDALFNSATYPAAVCQDRNIVLCTRLFIIKNLLNVAESCNLNQVLSSAVIHFLDDSDSEDAALNKLAQETFKSHIAEPIIEAFSQSGPLHTEYEKTLELLKVSIKGSNNVVPNLSKTGVLLGKTIVNTEDAEQLNGVINSRGDAALSIMKNSPKIHENVRPLFSLLLDTPDKLGSRFINCVSIIASGINYTLGREAVISLAKKTGTDVHTAIENYDSQADWSQFINTFKIIKKGVTTPTLMASDSTDSSGSNNLRNKYLYTFINEFKTTFAGLRRLERDKSAFAAAEDDISQLGTDKAAVTALPVYIDGIYSSAGYDLVTGKLYNLDSTQAKRSQKEQQAKSKAAAAKYLKTGVADTSTPVSTRTALPGEKITDNLEVKTAQGGELIASVVMHGNIRALQNVKNVSNEMLSGFSKGPVLKSKYKYGSLVNNQEIVGLRKLYNTERNALAELTMLFNRAASGFNGSAQVINELTTFRDNILRAMVSVDAAFYEGLSDNGKLQIYDPVNQKYAIDRLKNIPTPLVDPKSVVSCLVVSPKAAESETLQELKTYMDTSMGEPDAKDPKKKVQNAMLLWDSVITELLIGGTYTGEEILNRFESLYRSSAVPEGAISVKEQPKPEKTKSREFLDLITPKGKEAFKTMFNKLFFAMTGDPKKLVDTLSKTVNNLNTQVDDAEYLSDTDTTSMTPDQLKEYESKKQNAIEQKKALEVKKATVLQFLRKLVLDTITSIDSQINISKNMINSKADYRDLRNHYLTVLDPIIKHINALISIDALTGYQAKDSISELTKQITSIKQGIDAGRTVEQILHDNLSLTEATRTEDEKLNHLANVLARIVAYYRFRYRNSPLEDSSNFEMIMNDVRKEFMITFLFKSLGASKVWASWVSASARKEPYIRFVTLAEVKDEYEHNSEYEEVQDSSVRQEVRIPITDFASIGWLVNNTHIDALWQQKNQAE